MLPTVFLSLEGAEQGFVDKVRRFLPDGLAYFYPRSFANGEELRKRARLSAGSPISPTSAKR